MSEQMLQDYGKMVDAKDRRIRELEAVVSVYRAKLLRVRDWVKYAAYSKGGVVAEIDRLLEGQDDGISQDKTER